MKPLGFVIASMLAVVYSAAAHADIFQWEYFDPADPSQGRRQSAMLAPDGTGVDAVPGANLHSRDLTMAYMDHADLSMAYLDYADLSNATLRGIDLRNASLVGANLFAADFSLFSLGIDPTFHSDLSSADLRQANLINANLTYATLTDANLTGTDVRSATFAYGFWTFATGITLAQLYSTASYQTHDLEGVTLWAHTLSGGNFAGQDLENANLGRSRLSGADFTDSNIRGASFEKTYPLAGGPEGSGITLAQLYSTASYQAHDLSGINVEWNNLAGGNFAGQNLTNANFNDAKLLDADFTAADARGAYLNPLQSVTNNFIRPDGHIDSLDLNAAALLVVRDYDGNPHDRDGDPIGPIPITVDEYLWMGPGGTLRFVFEEDAWDSTISFARGIPATLGGTLELSFASDVNLASQLGRTFDLFDWTGVHPTGAFTISSPYVWDLSNLYTTGEVALAAIPEPSTLVLLALGCFAAAAARTSTKWDPQS